MIDKIWDALWKIGEKMWEAKQKPEHKGKPLKQFWKDWRADVKKQQEEYKKLPFKTKLKMFFVDFAKKMGILILTTILTTLILIYL